MAPIMCIPLTCQRMQLAVREVASTRASQRVYRLVEAPTYWLNRIFEALSETSVLSRVGWGIIVLARKGQNC